VSRDRTGIALEARIARLLEVGTNAAMILISIGVLLMGLTGRSPRDVAPSLDPSRLLDDIIEIRPSGFIWLGVLLLLATPTARVATALVGFVREGEREMALVAGTILAVVALGVVAGTAGG
jgi:uncharacterized membrane protein